MYILLIGYLYVIVMFAAGTGDPAKAAVWIVLLAVLPTWLFIWIKRRGQINRRAKQQERTEDAARKAAALAAEEGANPAARSDLPSGR
ncbi:hypothetical protein SAMN02745857_02391 [Andreprevotia lacus DSM 23236]|jgi:Flp pilus assembly protein TadB|uniref:Uncharacterized protein n=1 Tax=Andreprevotia lacus DSM 23236 TaxID=1121001 RepID=A0A1W1XQL3_9NEIS|nr:hypothetical protein [Andreprevotia lacus]SMC26164.1 hypothetical protein SAMN02745857_02391 [Andreprevotia lacus DSM 23236]